MNELEVSRGALLRVLLERPICVCGAPGIADDCDYTSELGSDLDTRTETTRIRVTLATSIPRELCEKINLGYPDPGSIDIEAWSRDPDTLVVPRAGEMLYRVKPSNQGKDS